MVSNEMKYKQMLVATPTRQMQFAVLAFGGPMFGRGALVSSKIPFTPLSKYRQAVRFGQGLASGYVSKNPRILVGSYLTALTLGHRAMLPVRGSLDAVVVSALALWYSRNIESRGGIIASSSQQQWLHPASIQLAHPSAQKTRRAQGLVSRGSAKRGRERLTPWCRVHKRRHWCRFTRK